MLLKLHGAAWLSCNITRAGVIFGLFKKLHPCNITRNLYLIEYAYLYLYMNTYPNLKSNSNLYENLYENLIFRQKNKA